MSGDPKIRRLRPHQARGLGRRPGPDGCAERDPATGKIAYSPVVLLSEQPTRDPFSAHATDHLLVFCPEAFEAS
jgi:hypothetical protein